MTVISGTIVRWPLSPRLIEVPSTETELTVADAQDTLQDLEDDVDGIVFPHTRETSGGEDLGGGISVGLTTELQNCKIAPNGTSPLSIGTVTTADANGIILTDSAATFQTDGVEPGDWIINFTDQSVTEILTVDSETQLTTRGLRDGTANTFSISDAYKVWEVKEFKLSGGNFVAVDSGGSPISPIFPVFGRFVSLASSSSATLQNQEQLEAASYIGKEGLTICIDPLNVSGKAVDSTAFPAGTREQPCLTEANFDVIHEARGIRNATIESNITLTDTHTHGPTFFGDNPQTVVVTLDPACSVPGCKFQDCYVQGQFTSGNIIWECIVGSISNANGFIYQSTIIGPIVVSGTLSMERCWTATPGTNNVIDFNGVANTVGITCWDGGTIEVKNMVAGCVFGMGGTAGSVYFDPVTCTGGSANYGGAIRLKSQTDADLAALGLSVNNASTSKQVRTELTTELAEISSTKTDTTDILADLVDIGSDLTDVHDEAFGKWEIDHVNNTLKLYRSNGALIKTFNLTSTTDSVPNYITRTPA